MHCTGIFFSFLLSHFTFSPYNLRFFTSVSLISLVSSPAVPLSAFSFLFSPLSIPISCPVLVLLPLSSYSFHFWDCCNNEANLINNCINSLFINTTCTYQILTVPVTLSRSFVFINYTVHVQ